MATPKEVIDLYYKYANANNWDAWCDLFAEDQVMDEQMGGHIEGLPALRKLMAGMKAAFPTFQNVPKHILVDGDQGAVVSHLHIVTASGQQVEVNVMNYFRFKDGKIAYMSNYHDTKPYDPKP